MCVCRMGIENRAEIFSRFLACVQIFWSQSTLATYEMTLTNMSRYVRGPRVVVGASAGAASGTAWRDAVALEGATTLTIACSSGSSILRALQRSPLGSSSSPSCSWPWTFLSLPPPTTTLPRTRYARSHAAPPHLNIKFPPPVSPDDRILFPLQTLSSLRERGWSLTVVMECTGWHLYFVCSPAVISALFWRFTVPTSVLLNGNTHSRRTWVTSVEGMPFFVVA